MILAPDFTRPDALLLAHGIDRTTVERITLHGSHADARLEEATW